MPTLLGKSVEQFQRSVSTNTIPPFYICITLVLLNSFPFEKPIYFDHMYTTLSIVNCNTKTLTILLNQTKQYCIILISVLAGVILTILLCAILIDDLMSTILHMK